MITVITVPGIGEPLSPSGSPIGMLENFTKHLPNDLYVCRQFNYRNQYGPVPDWGGTAYDENLHNAVAELAAVIHRDPNNVILVGYSAGAHVVSQLLSAMSAGIYPNLVVSAAVLIANPVRARNEPPHWVGAPVNFGLAGEHGPWPQEIPTFHLHNQDDIICCSDEHSPLRGLSDLTRSFSFTNPWRWIASLIHSAVTGKNQSWNPFTRHAWSRALDGAIGYLDQTQHVQWYLGPGRMEALARDVTRYMEPENE